MLNGKYIPLDAALESIFSNSGYMSNLNHASACIWAGEVLDMMGVPATYIKKVTDGNISLDHPPPLVVQDYRAFLPPDCYKIIQVRDCKTRTALRETTNTFHKAHNNYAQPSTNNNNPISGDQGSDLEGGVWQQNASNTSGGTSWEGVATYETNGYYIFTSIKSLKLEVSYMAFAVDKDGVPLIPDDETIKLAMAAYIKMNHYQRLWEVGDIPDKVFTRTEQEYDWAVGRAVSRARTPNADQLESMKNIILRLVPKINSAHRNFFENVGNQEQFARNNNNSAWNNL